MQLGDGGDGRLQRKANSRWHARGRTPNTFSERAQWSWLPKKATSDKHSTSGRLKGKSSLVSAATCVFTSAESPWWDQGFFCVLPMGKTALRPSWNNISAEQGFHSKNDSRQYINVTQRALSAQRGPRGVVGRLLSKEAALNWRILQHLKDIMGKLRRNELVCFWHSSFYLKSNIIQSKFSLWKLQKCLTCCLSSSFLFYPTTDKTEFLRDLSTLTWWNIIRNYWLSSKKSSNSSSNDWGRLQPYWVSFSDTAVSPPQGSDPSPA